MNQEIPTFSIIIPVLNGEEHILRTINSCLNQTQLPLEIIVIDDGSLDKTIEIIETLQNDLIVLIKNKTNQGVSYSRNVGIHEARASWIMFLDADDSFHPNKIEIISYCIQKNDRVGAMGHGFNLESDQAFIPSRSWKEHLLFRPISVTKELLKNQMVTPSFTVSSNNKILFNQNMLFAEDHDFILRTVEKFPVYFLDLPLCSLGRFPLTKGGLSSNKWKMRTGEMSMYIDYCKRHHKYFSMPFLLLFSLMKHIRNKVISVQ